MFEAPEDGVQTAADEVFEVFGGLLGDGPIVFREVSRGGVVHHDVELAPGPEDVVEQPLGVLLCAQIAHEELRLPSPVDDGIGHSLAAIRGTSDDCPASSSVLLEAR